MHFDSPVSESHTCTDGAFPTWPHSRSWGYAPSGVLGLVLVVVLILFLMGRL